ncbi:MULTISPECIES: hypothetical protein [unclassified Brevundimonas]|uniref:hypothetical protein n=1 Tax=unclassified Brevundimonas TaxID=2622653 RepID=UPI0025BEE103|nr:MULTISPECIES: hypothetical protein [unclassified Brevundimonas]
MPGVVLIAALIPVSDAIQTTGGSDLVAGLLRTVFGGMPGILAVGGVMLASMAVTPFLYPNISKPRRTTPGAFCWPGCNTHRTCVWLDRMELKSEERSVLALPTSSDDVPATIDVHNVSLIDAL